MTLSLPREWCSTGTKTDPGAAAVLTGFVSGNPVASAHVNYLLNQLTAASRKAFLAQTCGLHLTGLEGTAITDTAERMAAVQRNAGTPIVAVKTAQAFGFGGSDRFGVQGVPASITSNVSDAATDGTRIVVVGSGGNHNTFSDDDGATWTAGGALGAAGGKVIWSSGLSLFLACTSSSVRRSTNAVAWSNSAGTAVQVGSGIAALSSGAIFGASSGGVVTKSTDGITFANTGGSVPGAGTLDNPGCYAGNNGTVFYHAGQHSSGANIVISSSADGITFTTLATLTPQGSASFDHTTFQVRLLLCPNTGLMVLVAPTTGNQIALFASADAGATWVGPRVLFPAISPLAFALAGGRLFMTLDDMLLASTGVDA